MGSNPNKKLEPIPTLAPFCMKKHLKSMISGQITDKESKT